MNFRELTEEEKARGANGDLLLWMEHEAEVNRDRSEYVGRGDPDPKYDLAPLLGGPTFSETRFFQEMERFFDGYKKSDRDEDSDPPTAEGSTSET